MQSATRSGVQKTVLCRPRQQSSSLGVFPVLFSIFSLPAGRALPSPSGYQGSCSRGQDCPCCLRWEHFKAEPEVPEKGSLTSVIESRGGAHPPLSLIHSRCAGAAHLNADVCNLLGLQGPDHHHVYVAKLVSADIFQANPRGPRLCPWD